MNSTAMQPNVDDLEALDRAHVFHPSTHLKDHAHGRDADAGSCAGGEGVYVIDRDGRREPRRLRRALLRQCRLRPAGDRRRDPRAGEAARLLPRLRRPHSTEPVIQLSRADHREGAGRACAGSTTASPARTPTRPRSSWSGTTTTCWAGREKKKIISRQRGYHGSGLMTGSLTGLPLFHNAFDLPLARRSCTPPARTTGGTPSPARASASSRARCAARARGADPGRRAGHGRRLHRRAGAGHRRHHPAARGLLGGDPGGAAQARRPADRRRGGHRLRPHRADVRLAHLRHRAGPDHHRQGPHLGLPAAVRRDRRREGLAGAGAGHRPARRRSATAGPIRPSALRRRRQRQSRHRRARGPHRQRARRPAPISRSGCTRRSTIIRMVGEVRGVGLLAALEFVADQATQAPLRSGAEGRRRRSPAAPRRGPDRPRHAARRHPGLRAAADR